MAKIVLYDDYRNAPRPQTLYGYVNEDAGTVTDPTVAGLNVTNYTEEFSYSTVTKRVTVPADSLIEIRVELNQTGGSATFDIYDHSGSAQLRVSDAGAGTKKLTARLQTTGSTKDVSIRVDDQSANGTASTNGIVIFERIGRVV